MMKHLSKLFIELGTGFAYMGNQYKITIDGRDFFLDMLFYHTRLRCYFIIELKTSELKPEHVGKLNFYLAAIDDLLKTPEDNPSIGLLLCQKKSKVIAEYALKRTDGPIGIAEYRLLRELPKELAGDLPPTEILESKLNLTSTEKIENAWDAVRSKFKDLTMRVFEKSGHIPQLEEPELFDEELLTWVASRQI